MIEANQLRKGNYISDTHNDGIKSDIVMVTQIADSGISYYTEEGDHFYKASLAELEFIELTEDMAMKFGFEIKISETGPPINEEMKSYVLDGYEIMQDRTGLWFLCGYNWNTKHFRYAHQLQNLYFALRGEELIFKKD